MAIYIYVSAYKLSLNEYKFRKKQRSDDRKST